MTSKYDDSNNPAEEASRLQPETPEFDNADHVRRTLLGERAAFDAIVRQYYGIVYAIAAARMHPDFDRADELCQEVFLRAYLQLGGLAQPDLFPAWLAQITRNLASDWQRKSRRQSALVQMIPDHHPDAVAAPSPDPSPREAAARCEEAGHIAAALARLSDEQRELLLLQYAENLTQSQVARHLQVHPSTVMRKTQQALDRLRSIYTRDSAAGLAGLRADDKNLRRTLAVIAAVWALPPMQKASLAATAEGSVSAVNAAPATAAGFWKTTQGQVTAAALAVGTLILAWGLITGGIGSGDGWFGSSPETSRATATGEATIVRAINEDGTDAEVRRAAKPALGAPANRFARNRHHARALTTSSTATGAIATMQSAQQIPEKVIEDAFADFNREGGTLGQVFDDKGNALYDVGVSFQIMTPAQPRFPSPNQQGHKVLSYAQPVQSHLVKYTDLNGRFQISPLATGTAVMAIDYPPFTQHIEKLELPNPNIEVHLAMADATIRGTAVHLTTGEPIAGARIAALPSREAQMRFDPRLSTQTLNLIGRPMKTETDARGNYMIDRLPAGKISLDATADDLIMVPRKFLGPDDIVLEIGKETRLPDIYMYPGHTMSGRVTDRQTGQPIAGVTVGFGVRGGNLHSTTGKAFTPAVTDENGNYRLTGLKPMIYGSTKSDELTFMHVTAEKEGYRPSSHRPTQPGGFDPTNLEMHHDFQLRPE